MESSSIIEMYRLDLEDLTKLISASTRPNIKRQLEQYKSLIESQMAEEKAKAKKEEQKAKPEEAKEKKEEEFNLNLQFQTITKYALDTSSDKFVKIYITDGFQDLKEINKQNIQSKFTKKSFDVYIIDWKKKNYRFNCFNLCKEIKPDSSYVKATSSGLVIYLAKAAEGDYWESLEKKKGLLDKDDDEDGDSKPKDKDPNASLMEMMKDMYQNGDPEMKKMIAEAWTKSQTETKEAADKK